MVITIDQGPGAGTCASSQTFSVNYHHATAPPAGGPAAQTYRFINRHGQDPEVTVDDFYFSAPRPATGP